MSSGLAFALGAKDTISNLFGSFTVVLDKPFQIGDWVHLGGTTEGIVEEVGFRSTRIRTFYDSLITVPNNQLTNINIDNYGKRTFRRYSTKLAITYDTPPDKIEAFCQGIRNLIEGYSDTRKDYYNVYLNNLNEYSLDILVYFFWNVDNWSKENACRHRFLLDIIRLAKELKVEFAFPTRVQYAINEKKANHQKIVKYHEKGEKIAKTIVQKPMDIPFEKLGGTTPEGDDGGE